jgi:hypothetical protein
MLGARERALFASGHGLRSRLRWHHDRCTQISCRLTAMTSRRMRQHVGAKEYVVPPVPRAGGSRKARQQRCGIRAVHGITRRARPEHIDARNGGLDRHEGIVGAENDLRGRYERGNGGEACR